ncbi:MAG: hypothetical protein ACK4ZJ_17270, partial [Allorhizobium sp.]|uniref:hypothetical protein n=1 Tax=Paracoccus hibiscisoli TaxID=2023261 RepID=UPI003919B5C5
PRCRHAAVAMEDTMLVFGGCLEREGTLRVYRLHSSAEVGAAAAAAAGAAEEKE